MSKSDLHLVTSASATSHLVLSEIARSLKVSVQSIYHETHQLEGVHYNKILLFTSSFM